MSEARVRDRRFPGDTVVPAPGVPAVPGVVVVFPIRHRDSEGFPEGGPPASE
jgi:hypothetical protein